VLVRLFGIRRRGDGETDAEVGGKSGSDLLQPSKRAVDVAEWGGDFEPNLKDPLVAKVKPDRVGLYVSPEHGVELACRRKPP
jgi:hypothetical protein